MTDITYIIHDPNTGEMHAQVGTDDLAYELAAWDYRSNLYAVAFDEKTGTLVSEDVTRGFVLMAIRAGDLNRDDEITERFYDWPKTVTLGDQEYYRSEKGLVEA